MPDALGGLKMVPDPQELELQAIVRLKMMIDDSEVKINQ